MGRGAGKIILGSAEATAGVLLDVFAGGAGGAGNALIVSGAANVFGGVAESLAKPPKLARNGLDLGAQIADPIQSLPIIFGTARVGINRVAIGSTNNNRLLWVVGAICQGPIASVNGVYMDGVLAATGVTLAGNNGGTATTDFHKDLGAWIAYGTDGQAGISPRQRTGVTVTNSVFVDGATRRLTLSTSSHGFIPGDMLESVGAVVGMATGLGYSVISVGTGGANNVDIGTVSDTRSSGSGGGGAVTYHTPTISSTNTGLGTAHNGRGVAWILLRLGYNANLWVNGLPRITVDVTAAGAYDPRAVLTRSVTGVSAGAGLGPYSTTILLTIPSHGFGEGTLFQLSGSNTGLDGVQRVERVIDSNTVQLCLANIATTGFTACTATVLANANDNPILAVRQLLTNTVWGASAPASEVDDTAVTTWANHCDELVYAPVPDTATFQNTRAITGTDAGSPNTTVHTSGGAGSYSAGQSVLFDSATVAPELRGQRGTVVGTPTTNQFQVNIATASSGGSGGTTQAQVQQKRFQLGGALDGGNSVKTNIESVLASCRGLLVYQGGIYSPSIRRATAVSLALGQDDIVGDWEFDLAGQRQMANAARATYPDPNYGWQLTQADWPPVWDNVHGLLANGFLTTDQNQLNRVDYDMPLVSNRSRAQQILMVRRRESRVPLRASVTCTEKALQAVVGDVCTVTHETPGWTNQPFWITQVQPLLNGTVRLSLEGYDATSYDYDANDDTKFAPLTVLPAIAGVAPAAPNVEAEFDQNGNLIVALSVGATSTTSGQPTPLGFRVVANDSTSGVPSDATVDAATFQDIGSNSWILVNLGNSIQPGHVAWIAAAAYTSATLALGSRSSTTVIQVSRHLNVPTALPAIIYARRSSSMTGDSALTTTVLPTLGFATTKNLTATVNDCLPFDVVLIDCNAWAVDEHSDFVKACLQAGLMVLTTGNDTSSGFFPVLTATVAAPVGQEIKASPPHPVHQGWTTYPNDGDGGDHITSVVDYATPTMTYAGGGIAAFTLTYPSRGTLYHDQSMSIVAASSGDIAQYIKNVVNFLTGRLIQTQPPGTAASLVMKVVRTSISGDSITVTVAVADPRPQGSGYITVTAAADGGAAVSPGSQTISGSATSDVDTTATTTFTVTRGLAAGRVKFRALATGRTMATDALDVEPSIKLLVCTARVTAVSATQVTVTVTATSNDGSTPTVELVGVTGSATVASGHSAGSFQPQNGTDNVWVFNRGAFQAGDGQAQFRAKHADGVTTDDDLVTISDQGRDTVGLVLRIETLSVTTSTIRVRLWGTDPLGGTFNVSLSNFVGLPSSPTIVGGTNVNPIDNSHAQDWDIPRPAVGAPPGRATFLLSATGRTSDADSVDVPPIDGIPLEMKIIRDSTTGNSITVHIAVADPAPQGAGYITVAALANGGASVAPSSLVIGGNATNDVDTTGTGGFTITRGSTPGRVSFKATAANRTMATDAIDVEQDPTTIGGANNTFGTLAQVSPDYVNNQVTLSWAWNGSTVSSYDLYIGDGLSAATPSPVLNQSGLSGGTTFFVYSTLGDIEASGTRVETIAFYVVAHVGTTLYTSTTNVVQYSRP